MANQHFRDKQRNRFL